MAATQSKLAKFSSPRRSTSDGYLVNPSMDFTDNRVNGEMHPAFENPALSRESTFGGSLARPDTLIDEGALFDSQQAFAEALAQYEKEADPKYKTGIDLSSTHTWEEVIEKVEVARKEYKGVDKEGTLTRIHSGLRNFHTAAPAIELWLKLLPSTSIYGSILCGGLTIILEAAVRLGKLREDTYLAIDEIPLRVERAEVFMRTYRDAKMKKQAADLYKAIIEALQHILGWYKRKAGMKYLSSLYKGPEYARNLKSKMKNVGDAAQAMDDQANLNQHMRLKDIRQVTWNSRSQLSNIEKTAEELKVIALEARDHMYAVFRDTEAWQEVVQFWAATRQANESKPMDLPQESNPAARDSLLQSLGHDNNQLMRDVEEALRQIFLIPIADQDRAIAIIEDPIVEKWIVEPGFGALLVNGHSRRDDNISPASIACSMIIHLFTNTVTKNRIPIITTYWFCGSHTNGSNGNASGLMRSLICQLLVAGPFDRAFMQTKDFDSQDLSKLLDMFKKLLRQLPEGTAVVCILDGVSFYEDFDLCDDTSKVIRKLVKLSRVDPPIFKVLAMCPMRMTKLHLEPDINKHASIIDIPQHVDGAKQGFNHRAMVTSTGKKVRRLSKSLPAVDSGAR